MNVGHRLREFRLRFNYTVEDLSSLINVTSGTILSWEKGEVTPNFEQLNELAALYDVSEEDLINTNKGINECYGDFDQDRKVDDEEVKNKSKVNKEKDIKSSKIKFKAKLEILRNLDTIFVILFVAIYLILGFTVSHGWAAYWPLILLGFVPSSIIKAIISKKSALLTNCSIVSLALPISSPPLPENIPFIPTIISCDTLNIADKIKGVISNAVLHIINLIIILKGISNPLSPIVSVLVVILCNSSNKNIARITNAIGVIIFFWMFKIPV